MEVHHISRLDKGTMSPLCTISEVLKSKTLCLNVLGISRRLFVRRRRRLAEDWKCLTLQILGTTGLHSSVAPKPSWTGTPSDIPRMASGVASNETHPNKKRKFETVSGSLNSLPASIRDSEYTSVNVLILYFAECDLDAFQEEIQKWSDVLSHLYHFNVTRKAIVGKKSQEAHTHALAFVQEFINKYANNRSALTICSFHGHGEVQGNNALQLMGKE